MEMKAVFYGRFSSKMQNETSIEGQRRVVEEFAKREGIEIVGEYIDRAKSGKNDKRPAFQKMIEDIKNKKIKTNIVLVYKLDRFARNEKLHRKFEDILNENAVVLWSATESVNNAERMTDKLLKAIALISNEEYVFKISQDVTRGKKEAAYKGEWCGGTPALGYDFDRNTKKLIINREEAKAVRLAFKLRAEGFSYRYIIERLNRRGYKTKLGNDFGKNSLYEIFRNIRYKGIYEYNKAASKGENDKFNRHASKSDDEIIRIKDESLRIVSDEVWNTVNEMSRKRSGIKPKGDYLLSGFVFCKCGTAMQVNRRNNHEKIYTSFFCPKHKNKKAECDAKEINLDLLEDFVLSQLADKIFDKQHVQNFIDSFSELDEKQIKSRKKQIREYKSTLKQNRQKITNCITQVENGCSVEFAEELSKRVEKLSSDNKKLEKLITKLEKKVDTTPTVDEVQALKSKFVEYMQSTVNLPLRKEYLQKLIEKIVVTDDEIEVIFNL